MLLVRNRKVKIVSSHGIGCQIGNGGRQGNTCQFTSTDYIQRTTFNYRFRTVVNIDA